jgi:hypothetical protein
MRHVRSETTGGTLRITTNVWIVVDGFVKSAELPILNVDVQGSTCL